MHLIFEILGVIFESFFGTITGFISAVPAIIELKDVIEQFTPMGMIQTGLLVVGIPTVVVSIIAFAIKYIVNRVHANR